MKEQDTTTAKEVLERNITAVNTRDMTGISPTSDPTLNFCSLAVSRCMGATKYDNIPRLCGGHFRTELKLRRSGSRRRCRGNRGRVHGRTYWPDAYTRRVDPTNRKRRHAPLGIDPANQRLPNRLGTCVSRSTRNDDTTRPDAISSERHGRQHGATANATSRGSKATSSRESRAQSISHSASRSTT